MAPERGSTLVIALLTLLVLIGLTISMTYTAQSEARMTTGVKLQQFYNTAAASVFNRVRVNLADYWVEPDPDLSTEDKRWRFGGLLLDAEAVTDVSAGNFPDDKFGSSMEMNAGLLDITYKIWVTNNLDDPAVIQDDPNDDDQTFEKNRDLDGKVVLTVEVFGPTDSGIPIAVQSAVIGPVGSETTFLYEDAVREGDESDVGGQGTGTKGDAARIEISSLENTVSP
jgi:hypothetical protein